MGEKISSSLLCTINGEKIEINGYISNDSYSVYPTGEDSTFPYDNNYECEMTLDIDSVGEDLKKYIFEAQGDSKKFKLLITVDNDILNDMSLEEFEEQVREEYPVDSKVSIYDVVHTILSLPRVYMDKEDKLTIEMEVQVNE